MNIKKSLYLFVVVFLNCQSLLAEVNTDGSIGLELNIALSNNTYNISEDIGKTSGTNLFHSFSSFNIESGNTATFSGSVDINNIMVRVTGNGASNINGAIQTTIIGANFWLINPQGVIIGENASFDVTGSINLSTADSISFDDGSAFGANLSETFQNFTTSSASSFGFLSDNLSSIIIDKANLTINDDRLVFVSKSITFSDANINLNNSELVVVANSGQSIINIDQLDTMSFDASDFGDINLIRSNIIIDGNNELPIVIKARKLELVDSRIFNLKADETNTDNINIDAKIIALNQSTIESINPEDIVSDNTSIDRSELLPDINSYGQNVKLSQEDLTGFPFLENSNKKVVSVSKEPCQSLQPSTSILVLSNMNKIVDPMSFNPGKQYYRLDSSAKSIMNDGQDPFIGCRA